MTHHEWIPEFWMTVPFIGLLLSIAIMPLVAGKFWSSLKNQALIALLFSLPVLFLGWKYAPHLLKKSLTDYVSFVILLASLYIVSGGICLSGGLLSTPAANTLLLACGALLSNLIGTTGRCSGPISTASIMLICRSSSSFLSATSAACLRPSEIRLSFLDF